MTKLFSDIQTFIIVLAIVQTLFWGAIILRNIIKK